MGFLPLKLSAAGAASVFSTWRNGRAPRRDCGCLCREAATTPPLRVGWGWAAQRGGLLGAVPLADGLLFGEPSQPRCALCALTWLGLGARAKGTASSSPSCPGPPRARRERRARTGGSSRHDRPAGAGVAGAPPGPRRGRLTGHEGRGEPTSWRGTGCGLTSDSAVEPPSRQRHDVGGLAPGCSVGPDWPACGRDGSLGLAGSGRGHEPTVRDRRGVLMPRSP